MGANPGWLAVSQPSVCTSSDLWVLGRPCPRGGVPLWNGPAVFHPSVLLTWGKGRCTPVRVVRHYVGVSGPWVHVVGAYAYVYADVMGGKGLPSPDPAVGTPGKGSPSTCLWALPSLSLWASELAFVSFIGGQKRGREHCGNSAGIPGIQPFRGQGDAWKTPTRLG